MYNNLIVGVQYILDNWRKTVKDRPHRSKVEVADNKSTRGCHTLHEQKNWDAGNPQ